MSTLSNFTGVNIQNDVLPRPLARSAIALIRGLQAKITSIGLDNLVASFQTHVADLNNPHMVSFSDFPSAVVQGLYPYYQAITQQPLSLSDYTTLCQDPITVLELIRRLILNNYSYQDYVGPVASSVYTGDDLSAVVPQYYPMYYASFAMGDRFLTVVNNTTITATPSRILPVEGFTLSALVTVNINDQVVSPTLTLANAQGYHVTMVHNTDRSVTITVTNARGNNAITSVLVSSDTNTSSLISITPSLVQVLTTAPYCHALTITPAAATYTYSYQGGLYTIQLYLDNSLVSPIDRISVNAPLAAPKGSGNTFGSIMLYPQALNSDDLDVLVASLL